jgi:molecular chaperone GrpE
MVKEDDKGMVSGASVSEDEQASVEVSSEDIETTRAEVSEQLDEETADIVVQAIDELAVRSSEIETLKAELDEVSDRWKRQAAEFQNYRRRTEQEKGQMVSFGKRLVIQQFLDIIDDFERSLDASTPDKTNKKKDKQSEYSSFRSGIELVYQKLMDALKKLDIEPIEAVGHPFDEELHEALMQQPAKDNEEVGIVLSEIQRGYRMGDHILRHSKVIVSS